MILIVHILIAVASIAHTISLMIRPTSTKLIVSYLFVAATIISGTALTIIDPSTMLHTCTAGLVYTIVVTTGIMLARKKYLLSATPVSNNG